MANAAAMGDPSTQIYHELLKQRIVVLGTDVNDGVANYISAQLLYLEGQDREKDIFPVSYTHLTLPTICSV